MVPPWILTFLMLSNVSFGCDKFESGYDCRFITVPCSSQINYDVQDDDIFSLRSFKRPESPQQQGVISKSSSSEAFFADDLVMYVEPIPRPIPHKQAFEIPMSLQHLSYICDRAKQDVVDEQEKVYARLRHLALIHRIIAKHHQVWTVSSVYCGAEKKKHVILTDEGKKQCGSYMYDLSDQYLFDQLRDIWNDASSDYNIRISCEQLLDFHRKNGGTK
ncbi:hypothetical protein HYV11_02835 [Candidatus Dependentiae bacterium]|nr:hypothetical protein [Candidatus Dependentiae bacterium]